MEYKILPFSENLSYNFEFFPAAYLKPSVHYISFSTFPHKNECCKQTISDHEYALTIYDIDKK